MQRLPDRPNLDHLKKQAKDLLSLFRNRDPAAITRIRNALPAAAAKTTRRSQASACGCTTPSRVSRASMASLLDRPESFVEARVAGATIAPSALDWCASSMPATCRGRKS